MLTYSLFKAQCMHLSETSRKGQPHADLQPVQNPEHALVSSRKGKPDADLHAVQSPEHALVSSRKGKPDTDLQAVQNPEHALVSNKQEGPTRCWLTCCSKPRACCCQQQAGMASQMLTYILFKTQSVLLSASEDKPKQSIHLHSVYNERTFSLAPS